MNTKGRTIYVYVPMYYCYTHIACTLEGEQSMIQWKQSSEKAFMGCVCTCNALPANFAEKNIPTRAAIIHDYTCTLVLIRRTSFFKHRDSLVLGTGYTVPSNRYLLWVFHTLWCSHTRGMVLNYMTYRERGWCVDVHVNESSEGLSCT